MEPPEDSAPQSSAAAGFAPRPVLSTILVVSIFFLLILNVAVNGTDVLGTLIYPTWNDVDVGAATVAEAALAALMVLSSLVFVLVYLVTIVVFCMWIHRANRNARALGAKWMEFTPGWSVGWWFIPIANLFKPYQAVREVYQASDPARGPDNWKTATVPAVFALWWATWIIGNLISNVTARLAWSWDPEKIAMGTYFGLAELALMILCSFAVVRIIRSIDARQLAKSAAPPADPTAGEMVTAPG